ncbi:MAG: adenosine deaminase family protein [Woeseiaceae bacterium]
MRKLLTITAILCTASANADWFEDLKQSGSNEDLYRVLYHMPKGGDLHNHLSGSNFSEWMYDLALAERERGYHYYTKVRIENCAEYGANEYGRDPYFLLFRNIMAIQYDALGDCEKSEYKRLEDLDEREKAAWMDSIRLDQPWEGRDEFFGTHWGRMNALGWNPWFQAETLFLNMQAFGEEGVSYLETQVSVSGMRLPDGTEISEAETIKILSDRLNAADARSTGVTARFQISVLRFLPNAEEILRHVYTTVDNNDELFVAVNMVGREDNDKGYPLRFLDTLRELRRQHSGVKLSIHAGEVDEPNYHVRDTLLLGADRIGHGNNLITDPDTMRLMRHGPYLIEINLISNLLLNYINDYSEHPFPEYLRTGIPVALSTDDRGMWDSTMTDEFFVAVKEFNLSWHEVKLLSRNSLQYAFVQDEEKVRLLREFSERMAKFEASMQKYGLDRVGDMPATRSFVCKRYELCQE